MDNVLPTYEAYKHSTYGSLRWAIRNKDTGARVEVRYLFDHPECGRMLTYRGFFRTRTEANAAIVQTVRTYQTQ